MEKCMFCWKEISGGYYDEETPYCCASRKRHLNRIKRVKSRCKEISDNETDDLSSTMWEQLDKVGINDDIETFNNSVEMNNIMQDYELKLVEVLSGLRDKLPDWMDPKEQ